MSKKKKVLYIISDIDKALAFEWVAGHLNHELFELSFLLLNKTESYLEKHLTLKGIPVFRIEEQNHLKAFLAIYRFLKKYRPDVVHCHLRRAEIAGIPAALAAGVRKRIYTRHSSTYNHLYHPRGVVLDRIIAGLASDIVAISRNVVEVLTVREKNPSRKIRLIHHGFDLSIFNQVDEREVKALMEKYKLPQTGKIIGMISRYIWLKGFEYSVPAVAELMHENPDLHLVIANAHGADSQGIRALIQQNLPEGRFTEIKFEENLPALYNCFDVFVHVPFDRTAEAFGQIYIEALAAGVPSVFTLSGVAPELIQDRKNALVVPFRDSNSIAEACRLLLNNEQLRDEIILNGKSSLAPFTLDLYIRKLENLYLEP
jgi:glycosyltransferase involved in cell wall biosynthesis